jgi:hypothetical protein
MRWIQKDVQDRIAQFKPNQSDTAAFAFRTWVIASKQKYEAWFARR